MVGVGRHGAATKEEGICRQLTSAEREKGDPGWANAHDDRKKQVLGKKTTAERRSLGNIPATRATVAMQGAPPKRTASLLRADALFSPPVKNVFSSASSSVCKNSYGRREGAIRTSEVEIGGERIGEIVA